MNWYMDRTVLPDGVISDFYDSEKEHLLFTIERPWKNNEPYVSCIPAAIYACQRSTYYGGDGVGGKPDYPCFELQNVPNRTQIKFHIANYPHDVNGCIGVGMTRADAYPAVWKSRQAFTKWMDIMEGVDEFTLFIRTVA